MNQRKAMSLGTLLKAKRIALRMTLDEVAQAAATSKSYLHELESDKSVPSIVICARLAVVLGVQVSAMAAASLIAARPGAK